MIYAALYSSIAQRAAVWCRALAVAGIALAVASPLAAQSTLRLRTLATPAASAAARREQASTATASAVSARNSPSGMSLPDEPADADALVVDQPDWEDGFAFDEAPPEETEPWLDPPRSMDRLWVHSEALAWRIQGMKAPALVTTSNANAGRESAGKIGEGTTLILFGGERIGDSVETAGRLRFGFWWSDTQQDGLEVRYLKGAAATNTFEAGSGTYPILARPFQNVEMDFMGEDVELIAFPGQLTGSVRVDASSRFDTLELLYRRPIVRGPCEQLDLYVGYRHGHLADHLSIHDTKTSIALGGPTAVGTTLEETDSFLVENHFHGAQVGVARWRRRGCWSTELTAKIAAGTTTRRSSLAGSTTVTVPLPGQTPDITVRNTGLLVQDSNAGIREDNLFGVLPEIGLTIGYDFSSNLRFTFGYTYMHWQGVTRAASLVDRQLNLTQLDPNGLVGASRPAFPRIGDGVGAQGFSLGLDYRF